MMVEWTLKERRAMRTRHDDTGQRSEERRRLHTNFVVLGVAVNVIFH
jgi:hypothetical protein